MQLVDRKTLMALASGSVLEADGEFSFKAFLKEYKMVLAKVKKENVGKNNLKVIYKKVYSELKKTWLKNHCPPIEFCGEGSSRAAYACQGGKCLKVAINNKGIAQNRQEAKTLNNANLYSCFTQIYDFDKSTGSSLMTECCAKATDKDFEKAYEITNLNGEGRSALIIYDVLDILSFKKFNIEKTLEYLQNEIEDNMSIDGKPNPESKYSEEKFKLLANIQKSKKIQFKVLRDLISFYKSNGESELLMGDLGEIDNWGLAIRNGKLIPVILDAGLSDKVFDQYYRG